MTLPFALNDVSWAACHLALRLRCRDSATSSVAISASQLASAMDVDAQQPSSTSTAAARVGRAIGSFDNDVTTDDSNEVDVDDDDTDVDVDVSLVPPSMRGSLFSSDRTKAARPSSQYPHQSFLSNFRSSWLQRCCVFVFVFLGLGFAQTHGVCSASELSTFSQATASATSRRLDPKKPVCTFDLMGKCNDPACQFQHLSVVAPPAGTFAVIFFLVVSLLT